MKINKSDFIMWTLGVICYLVLLGVGLYIDSLPYIPRESLGWPDFVDKENSALGALYMVGFVVLPMYVTISISYWRK